MPRGENKKKRLNESYWISREKEYVIRRKKIKEEFMERERRKIERKKCRWKK